jgi:hypothetical protein
MTTLSPLPEVLLNTTTLSMAEKAGSRNSTAGKIKDQSQNGKNTKSCYIANFSISLFSSRKPATSWQGVF